MASPIAHFEIIGKDAEALRDYYEQLFEWKADTNVTVASEVSDAGNYGFIDAGDSGGIPGGIGGGKQYSPHVIFYVGVTNVQEALVKAEQLGGKRVLGPAAKPDGTLVIGQFTDLEGNLIGLAGPR